MDSEKFWNPYLAGIALGLVLLATFLVMGRGLGASGAAHRIAVFGIDLVAMSTHGRTGVSRWVLGSVAEKVLRASSTPLLLVRAPGAGAERA